TEAASSPHCWRAPACAEANDTLHLTSATCSGRSAPALLRAPSGEGEGVSRTPGTTGTAAGAGSGLRALRSLLAPALYERAHLASNPWWQGRGAGGRFVAPVHARRLEAASPPRLAKCLHAASNVALHPAAPAGIITLAWRGAFCRCRLSR